ncbi:hypothetical protein [Asanoa siamensis]|uniref:Uncharacterized protein n=1 Tax=Asanoa siamensis TaxID=926357 RepID=A0ABQ4CPD0_9ACTN|nr:hypothetical protein [Asanoa siamensis]GIF73107.1 hypothetical protein Asi02nite_26250 [Asanoa siamensis]
MAADEQRQVRPADISDTYWQVPVSDYVPQGDAPERSIVDEPRRRLELVWDSAVKTLHADARHPDPDAETARRLREFTNLVEARKAERAEERRATEAETQAAAATAENPPSAGDIMLRIAHALMPATLVQRLLPERN